MKFKHLMIAILAGAMIITSCSKDEPAINEAQVLAEYLESTASPYMKDYVNTDMPSIISASDVRTANLAVPRRIHIIDIRSAADFNTAHIEFAVNVTPANILTHMETLTLANYDKIAIVCYTGQTAGWVASLLRIMGYNTVFSMKWGMSSWNATFAGSWNTAAITNGNSQATNFVTAPTAKAATGELPVLSTGKTTGQEILEARVAAVLAEGFDAAKITNATVFGALTNYYIVNYWPEDQYNIKHIPGSMQYTPKASIKLAADLKTLPTNKTVVLYCYTGQTSAFLAAYLRLLGYDAKSLLFGTNGMIHDIMVATPAMAGSTWTSAAFMDYPTVPSGAK